MASALYPAPSGGARTRASGWNERLGTTVRVGGDGLGVHLVVRGIDPARVRRLFRDPAPRDSRGRGEANYLSRPSWSWSCPHWCRRGSFLVGVDLAVGSPSLPRRPGVYAVIHGSGFRLREVEGDFGLAWEALRRLVQDLSGGVVVDAQTSWLHLAVDVCEDFGRSPQDRAAAALVGYPPGEEPLHEHLRHLELRGCIPAAMPSDERPAGATGFFVHTSRRTVECYDMDQADSDLPDGRRHRWVDDTGDGPLDRTRVEFRVKKPEALRTAAIGHPNTIAAGLSRLVQDFEASSAARVYAEPPDGRHRRRPLDPRFERLALRPLRLWAADPRGRRLVALTPPLAPPHAPRPRFILPPSRLGRTSGGPRSRGRGSRSVPGPPAPSSPSP